MGQVKAAAQRKTGIKARGYYLVCGLIVALYAYLYSLDQIFLIWDNFKNVIESKDFAFSLEGRIIIQQMALLLAAICTSWYVLTGNRFSYFTVNKHLPKLDGFAIFFMVIYFVGYLDLASINDYMRKEEIPLPLVILFPLMVLGAIGSIVEKIHGWLGLPFPDAEKYIYPLILPAMFIASYFFDLGGHSTTFLIVTVIGIPFAIFYVPVFVMVAKEYIKEHPEYRKMFIFGRGGAARWGGLYSYLKYDFNDFMRKNESKDAPIYCGWTLWYDDVKLGGRHIGLDSDSMMLTVAAMGGGKSLYAAWNTLLLWPGGAFVLDPKGEHAQRTIDVRSEIASSHVIDPWGEVPHLYEGGTGATFNPLEEININSPNAKDDIFQIVESCILQEADENANAKHFRENAQKIMTGVIAHVLSEYPEKDHNLPTIYDIILTGDADGIASDPKAFDLLVDRMAVNDAMGRAPMDAAKVLKEAGENERGGFVTTLATGLSWVNTPVLRPILMKSSFKLGDIKGTRETVYLVIPFEHMKNHSRFLRTVVSLGLMSCRAHAEHHFKTLYMLDEFPQLGTFRPIKEGLVTLRSRDVKIWMHLQNLGQLKERYGNWQDFMSSCDKQFFAVNDFGTAEEISDMLGEYVERWLEGKEGSTSYIDKNRSLRSPSEVMEELKKGSRLQYVLPADGLPMRLKLVSFKKNFKKYGTVKGNKFG